MSYYYTSKNSDERIATHREQIQQRKGHTGLFPLNYVVNVKENLWRNKDSPAVTPIHYR